MLVTKLVFCLLATTTTTVLAQFSVVITNIQNVNAKILQTKQDVDAFAGTSAQTAAVNNDVQALKNQMQSAATQIDNSPHPATAAQCQQILDYVNNNVQPNSKATLASTKAKKTQFNAAGLRTVVYNSLVQLKQAADTYATAGINICPAAKKAAAQATKDKVDADFNDAIAAFK